MAITPVVNNKVELIAFRAAEAANYLRIGSRKYFKDQLVGKRNGQTYDFVVRDAGEFQEGMDLSGHGASNLTERKVSKSLQLGNIVIETNLLNKVTDIDWDDDIAKINGPKLIHGVVRKAVDADLGLQNTAFVGSGFQPLFKAQNFLKTVSDAPSYGFINPMINSVLSSNGQSFSPAEASDVFSGAGLVGKLSDVEYRANQYLPMVSVDAALVTALKTATSVVYAADARTGHEHDATLTFTGVANAIVPKGYVLWIKGCYAADICGDKTSALKAFIAYADGTSDGTDSVMYIREVNFTGEGTKEVTDKDGAALTVSTLNALVNTNDKVKAAIDFLPAGDYFGGFIRIDGSMEFETVDQLDASNADTKKETVEGLTVIENRAVDVMKGTNTTRWTVVSMSGIVEPREVAYVLVKDAVINVVTTNP
jgi:hypothetical protein